MVMAKLYNPIDRWWTDAAAPMPPPYVADASPMANHATMVRAAAMWCRARGFIHYLECTKVLSNRGSMNQIVERADVLAFAPKHAWRSIMIECKGSVGGGLASEWRKGARHPSVIGRAMGNLRFFCAPAGAMAHLIDRSLYRSAVWNGRVPIHIQSFGLLEVTGGRAEVTIQPKPWPVNDDDILGRILRRDLDIILRDMNYLFGARARAASLSQSMRSHRHKLVEAVRWARLMQRERLWGRAAACWRDVWTEMNALALLRGYR